MQNENGKTQNLNLLKSNDYYEKEETRESVNYFV